MRAMGWITLGAVGYGVYRAWKSYNVRNGERAGTAT